MAFAEDMTVFFSGDEFAVEATFTPTGGASVTANVILDRPTEDLLGGDALSDEYAITYPASALPGVRAGDIGTIAGTRYRIRSAKAQGDGALVQAVLTKL